MRQQARNLGLTRESALAGSINEGALREGLNLV
jgi:hypothetical protein